jgi:hypothetical protein
MVIDGIGRTRSLGVIGWKEGSTLVSRSKKGPFNRGGVCVTSYNYLGLLSDGMVELQACSSKNKGSARGNRGFENRVCMKCLTWMSISVSKNISNLWSR